MDAASVVYQFRNRRWSQQARHHQGSPMYSHQSPANQLELMHPALEKWVYLWLVLQRNKSVSSKANYVISKMTVTIVYKLLLPRIPWEKHRYLQGTALTPSGEIILSFSKGTMSSSFLSLTSPHPIWQGWKLVIWTKVLTFRQVALGCYFYWTRYSPSQLRSLIFTPMYALLCMMEINWHPTLHNRKEKNPQWYFPFKKEDKNTQKYTNTASHELNSTCKTLF